MPALFNNDPVSSVSTVLSNAVICSGDRVQDANNNFSATDDKLKVRVNLRA